MKINNLKEAKNFLSNFIPKQGGQLFTGDWGLKRTKYFLSLLGYPQNKLKVIHIAGTSGKGSTATLTSLLLTSQGFKTGLSVSPHIVDIRERCQINNQLISEKEFCLALQELVPFIEKVKNSSYGTPTYFEILIVLAFYIFYKKQVDYAVVETGLGGLYDATNSVDNKNKLVILTKIGFDHTYILGNTLSKIAYQKAMIIKKNNHAISIWQEKSARTAIEKIAKQNKSTLTYVKPNINFKNIQVNSQNTIFDYSFDKIKIPSIHLKLLGSYQAENCSLALTSLYLLAKRDRFEVNINTIKKTLKNVLVLGRMEIFHHKGKTIIVDGAHNPQKMTAFLNSLKKLYPGKKIDFIIAFKNNKDYKTMIKYIIPIAKQIILTSFFTKNQDLIHLSADSESIARQLKKNNFRDYKTIPDPQEALLSVLNSKKDFNNILVITGSFYLIGELYPTLIKI